MKKSILAVFITAILFLPQKANAALINIEKSGDLTVNVLAAQEGESLNLKSNHLANAPKGSKITLTKNNQKLELKVEDDNQSETFDVTGTEQELVEIEKYFAPQVMTIKSSGSDFTITQADAVAKTSFPIEVDTQSKKIMIKTESGLKYLRVLPLEALNSLKALGIKPQDQNINIIENENSELVYETKGEKIIDVLSIYEYKIPLTANLSATSGEIEKIDGPIWYKIFGFLLV